MKVHRRIIALILLLAATALAAEPSQSTGPVRSGYEALRDAVYNSEAVPQLEVLYARALAAIEAADLTAPDRSLWTSRIEYLLARGYQAVEDRQRAADHFEKGRSYLGPLVESGDSSEAFRMMSECLSQLCLVKGLGFILANGPKVAPYAEKALALDPRNAAAAIIIAAGKVYPPPLFGGDPRAGIALMEKALALGTADRDDLFNINLGVGLAWGKLGKSDEARTWLGRALELYPGSRFARAEYKKAGGKP